ncbi:MAG: KTSC domain-containing protein [Acidobacteria bacterium]|nr:MAG: KTSC domain-containing protein [Acidobacteriota bacterium]
MERRTVGSSSLTSMGYDSRSETLEVEFTNGAVYQYYNVPLTLYEAFIAAASKGQFYNSQIKDAFPYARVA